MLPVETVHLVAGTAEAWLAPTRGGMVTRLRLGGEDVLYLDEPTLADPTKNVRGGVPILFPIGGKPDDRALKQHGFARNFPWRAIQTQPTAVLELEAPSETRAAYPYDFRLIYTYTLGETSLRIDQRFENRGEAPMPIRPGLHPYFAVADKATARVETDATVAWDNVAGARVPFRGLDLTAGEIDMHLLDHHPAGTRLSRPPARDVVLSWSADQRVLVVWTLPGKPFVCVEPWLAPASTPSTLVPPGGAHESWLSISI